MKLSNMGRAQWWAAAAIAALGVAVIGFAQAQEPAKAAKAAKYIGAMKCKNCHASPDVGNQFDSWQKSGHAKAFETLASEAAKKYAAAKGIADPQKDDKCLKCHVTALGIPAAQVDKKFDQKLGVQCESCHGAGSDHMAARLKAAGEEAEGAPKSFKQVGSGEIVAEPGVAVCLSCHNSESPSFKSFCFAKSEAKIRHLHPLKPRTEEQKKALEAKGCDDNCKCTDGCPAKTCGACPEDK